MTYLGSAAEVKEETYMIVPQSSPLITAYADKEKAAAISRQTAIENSEVDPS